MKRNIAIVSMLLVLGTATTTPATYAANSGNGASFSTLLVDSQIPATNASGTSYVNPNNRDFKNTDNLAENGALDARYKSCEKKSINSNSWQSWKEGGQSSGDVCAFGPSSLFQ